MKTNGTWNFIFYETTENFFKEFTKDMKLNVMESLKNQLGNCVRIKIIT